MWQRFVWDLHGYIRKFFKVGNYILNGYARFEDFEYEKWEKNYEIDFNLFYKQDLLKQAVHKQWHNFTDIERIVFKLWIKEHSIKQIMLLTDLNYKQIDNAIQRFLKKVKNYE